MKDQTYYKILDVSQSANQQEIKSAYRKRMKEIHPDLNPKIKSATTITEIINEAYKILSNSSLRAAYDLDLDNKQNSNSSNKQSSPKSRISKGWLNVIIAMLLIFAINFFSHQLTNSSNTGTTNKNNLPSATPTIDAWNKDISINDCAKDSPYNQCKCLADYIWSNYTEEQIKEFSATNNIPADVKAETNYCKQSYPPIDSPTPTPPQPTATSAQPMSNARLQQLLGPYIPGVN